MIRRLLTALLLCLPLFAQAQDPVAQTQSGPVRGAAIGRGAVFRGIPYAMPPLGERRWKAPEAVSAWVEPREAKISGAPCLQGDFGWNAKEAAASREDCLTLDVRTPNFKPEAKLPVMVWFHGGGNRGGAGSEMASSPIVLHGLVMVDFQYRLGIFGFLSHPALTAESGHHASGNYGLLDQIAALKWVQANIATFGGDPANVTIVGESAGAQDIGLLMLSPLAHGLFARAIEESGTAGFGLAPRPLAENEALAAGHPIDELRKMPGDKLLELQKTLHAPNVEDPSFLWLAATIDGWVIPKAPVDLPAPMLPLLIGSNGRELHLYGDLQTNIERAFGVNAKRMRGIYGSLEADDLAADLTFRCPAQVAARHNAGPVWLYEFNIGPNLTHAGEIPVIFGQGSQMQTYWVNFARSGDPNGDGLPVWPRFEPKNGAYLDFTSDGPMPKANLRRIICQLLPRL